MLGSLLVSLDTDLLTILLDLPLSLADFLHYRLAGHYYVVDRLIDVAELRLGEKPQVVVRITRTSPAGQGG